MTDESKNDSKPIDAVISYWKARARVEYSMFDLDHDSIITKSEIEKRAKARIEKIQIDSQRDEKDKALSLPELRLRENGRLLEYAYLCYMLDHPDEIRTYRKISEAIEPAIREADKDKDKLISAEDCKKLEPILMNCTDLVDIAKLKSYTPPQLSEINERLGIKLSKS